MALVTATPFAATRPVGVVVPNPSSDTGIKAILKKLHPDTRISQDALTLIQMMIRPFETEFGAIIEPIHDNPEENCPIEEFLLERIKGELARHAISEFRRCGRVKSAVIEYLIAEEIELSGNVSRDNRRATISERDVIVSTVNDTELLTFFRDQIPVFVHIAPPTEPQMRGVLMGRKRLTLPDRNFTQDYKEGIHNLAIAIVNYYGKITEHDVRRDIATVARLAGRAGETMTKSPYYHIQDQILRTVMGYSMAIQPEGNLKYSVLISSVTNNPYLRGIPINQIIEENSMMVKDLRIIDGEFPPGLIQEPTIPFKKIPGEIGTYRNEEYGLIAQVSDGFVKAIAREIDGKRRDLTPDDIRLAVGKGLTI